MRTSITLVALLNPLAIQDVKLGLDDRVTDIDGGDPERTGLGHLEGVVTNHLACGGGTDLVLLIAEPKAPLVLPAPFAELGDGLDPGKQVAERRGLSCSDTPGQA